MPISDRLVDATLLNGGVPQHPPISNTGVDLQPSFNSMMRCPLPPLQVSPDSLRQFYRGGQLPQTRILTPNNIAISGEGESGAGNVTATSGSETVGLLVQQAAITTPIINPNNSFDSTLGLGRVFQLIQVSTSAPARVRLYGTLNALQLDSYRELDVAPAFGTEQGLILDVALDEVPYTFPLEGISGSNYDTVQAPVAYISVTNIGQATTPITVTFSYVPLVN